MFISFSYSYSDWPFFPTEKFAILPCCGSLFRFTKSERREWEGAVALFKTQDTNIATELLLPVHKGTARFQTNWTKGSMNHRFVFPVWEITVTTQTSNCHVYFQVRNFLMHASTSHPYESSSNIFPYL